MSRNILFTELEQLLLKLGFTTLPTAGSHHVFQYPSSGVLVILPGYDKKAYVDTVHMVAVRRILIENGLINNSAFDNLLEKIPS
ncbi:type II toxin-antitoxin system HicA family toxin [Komarekiella sp. 'clone 1']|uniref:Type II toxin-antitoxin system HicA family toxin n=1 Tax=Komarekiella delphini-convector SJRDD-AB1 TaxID=2593771 RepID=A0AA40T0X4_9NOST|nr:type II toxin-antitoxin system HicA family toxin [Komarekiella delphini-convector]MBD6618951.1 type II toxin-antitoxin system HicA family toxin [Komarekiella delphini-convector SJRDD-AB1]